VLLLLVAYHVPTSPILVTLMMVMIGRFLQEPHGVTSQKMPFFNMYSICSLRASVASCLSRSYLADSCYPDDGDDRSVLTRATQRKIPEEGIL
jgi:hypothetical protein